MSLGNKFEEAGIYDMDERIAFLIFAGLEDQFTNWIDSDKMPTDDKAQAHVKLYATMKSLLNDEALILWQRYRELMD